MKKHPLIFTIHLYHFIWISVLLTQFIIITYDLLFHRMLIREHLLIGFIASLIVSIIVISLIRMIRRMEQQAREQMQAIEQKYQDIFENAPIGIFQSTPEGRYLSVNPTLALMYGYETPEKMVKSIRNIEKQIFVDKATRKHLYEELERKNEVTEFEARVKRRDGKIIWTSRNVRAVKDIQGTIHYLEGFVTDITQRKEAEENLKKAKLTAEEATRYKSQFLANMSHEIRTPINAIIGLTELTMNTALSPQQQDYLSKVVSSSRFLLSIINDILDFSKIEAGKLELAEHPFNLMEVTDRVVDMLSATADRKGLELSIFIDPNAPLSLTGDSHRLGQVLVNLVSNAVKFTDNGEVGLEITELKRESDTTLLHFSVHDTGIGIPASKLDRLFQSFSQINGTTSRRYGGTGLGLTISKRIVELMNGTIEVESEPEKGSTFTFTASFKLQPEHVYLKDMVPRSLKGKAILLVDNNPTIRRNLTRTLTSVGFHVNRADSGKDALEMLHSLDPDKTYDLILLDWLMPGMDGVETLQAIRLLGKSSKAPAIIMSSAQGCQEVCSLAENLGLHTCVDKPVNPSTLLRAIIQTFHTEEPLDMARSGKKTFLRVPEFLRRSNILLVEDNEVNRRVMEKLLHTLDLPVDIAVNGEDAVDKILNGTKAYQAVLMDIQMPEMDGYEATRRIRKDHRFKELPIIAMTAHAMEEDREKSLAAGMNEHITKPVETGELIEKLIQWVRPADK